MFGVHVRQFGILLTCISWDVTESQSSGVCGCGLWKLHWSTVLQVQHEDVKGYLISLHGNSKFYRLSPQYLSIIYQGLFFFLDLQRYEKCCNWKQQTKSQLDCFGSSSKVCPLLLSFSLIHNRSGIMIHRSQALFCFNFDY